MHDGGSLQRRRGQEAVWGGARRRGVTVKAVGIAGASTLAPVAVNGRLQLTRRAQTFLVTLKWVQVLHVPVERKIKSLLEKQNKNMFLDLWNI